MINAGMRVNLDRSIKNKLCHSILCHRYIDVVDPLSDGSPDLFSFLMHYLIDKAHTNVLNS